MWIAVYSYLMVWWATVAGNTIGIPSTVKLIFFKITICPDHSEFPESRIKTVSDLKVTCAQTIKKFEEDKQNVVSSEFLLKEWL
jgi:hypothetical protein